MITQCIKSLKNLKSKTIKFIFFVFLFNFLQNRAAVDIVESAQKSYKLELDDRINRQGLSGNWVKKLAWLKEAVEYDSLVTSLHKEILTARSVVYEPKIEKIQQSLKNSRSATKGSSRGLDSAILQLQYEIEEKLNRVQDVARKADLANYQQDARFKMFEAEGRIADNKEKLAHLKMNISLIEDLQKTFIDRVAKLDEYIEKAAEIAKSSENKVKEIFDVFDDEKAKALTFYVKGLLDQMKKVHKYIKEEALASFDSEQVALSKGIEDLNAQTTKIRDEFTKVCAEIINIEKSIDAINLDIPVIVDPIVTTKEQAGNIATVAAEVKEGEKVLPVVKPISAFMQLVLFVKNILYKFISLFISF